MRTPTDAVVVFNGNEAHVTVEPDRSARVCDCSNGDQCDNCGACVPACSTDEEDGVPQARVVFRRGHFECDACGHVFKSFDHNRNDCGEAR